MKTKAKKPVESKPKGKKKSSISIKKDIKKAAKAISEKLTIVNDDFNVTNYNKEGNTIECLNLQDESTKTLNMVSKINHEGSLIRPTDFRHTHAVSSSDVTYVLGDTGSGEEDKKDKTVIGHKPIANNQFQQSLQLKKLVETGKVVMLTPQEASDYQSGKSLKEIVKESSASVIVSELKNSARTLNVNLRNITLGDLIDIAAVIHRMSGSPQRD